MVDDLREIVDVVQVLHDRDRSLQCNAEDRS
jgi:hypothetical protein